MNGQPQHFVPPQTRLESIASNAAYLLTVFRQVFIGLNEQERRANTGAQLRAMQLQREPERQSLLAFEKELTQLRKLYTANQLSLAVIKPELRKWVLYERAHFYTQLKLAYQDAGFWPDAERVELLGQKGGSYRTDLKDEHGNTVGTETFTDTKGKPLHKEGNAVEVEFR